MKTRICLVEDNTDTRVNLMKVLQQTSQLICINCFPDAETALKQIPCDVPDVVLMDIRLPGMSGIECVARLKEKLPQLTVLMLTTYEESDLIFDSLRAGASGYLLKNMAAAELRNAVVQAHEGGSPLSMPIANRIVSYFQKQKPCRPEEELTRREQEILSLLVKGLLYKEIADQLHISINTVRVHISRVFEKLHVHSRGQAVSRYLGR